MDKNKPDPLAPYRAFTDRHRQAGRERHLRTAIPLPEGRVEIAGRRLLSFAGNDYLGLAHHPALRERAVAYVQAYGTGAGASRLVTGNLPFYDRIEARLAAAKGYDRALVMTSGMQANMTVLAALADPAVRGPGVTVFADRLCHNSLLQGARLSGARLVRFRHNDPEHLENLLKAHAARPDPGRGLIVSETVFSMEGDVADVEALRTLARRFGALLYLDEAHAFGLSGPGGFGLTATEGADVVMGTFGKALGSFGAFVACREDLAAYLVQRCGGLIYSTALPPPVLGAIEAGLELLPTLDDSRARLRDMSRRLRIALRDQGWEVRGGETPIIPLLIGPEQKTLDLAAALLNRGLVVPAIRPPTVPPHASRLRVTLSAAHTDADLEALLAALGDLLPKAPNR